jgi:hypothetical protein
VKENIAKIQKENRRGFNSKRKKALTHREKDIAAIKRTQQGPGLELVNKYLGPYKVVKVLRTR